MSVFRRSGPWHLLLVLLFLTGLTARLDAGRYVGQITGVAEGGMEEFFYYWDLGETWTLSYSYESNSIDGTFTPANGDLQIRPVSGNIFLTETSAFDFPIGPSLQVIGAVVTGFSLITDPGVWTITESWWDFDGFGGGSVTITDPRLVPETATTAGLLLLALVACGAARVARSASVRGKVNV